MRIRIWLPAAILFMGLGTAHGAAQRLLLTAVVVSPTPAEFIAIYNPNAAPVDLTDYYLADYETYYNVVVGTAPGSSDFVVRFPAGTYIGPQETQYISIAGAECFKSACATIGTFVGFGVYPNYEILSATAVNNSALVPDMLGPFFGAVGTNHGLTNGGEPVMLFYWDGVSNLVTDVDYVYYGTPSAGSPAVNKTGVMVNGSSYLPDTADSAALHAPLGVGAATTQTCRAVPFSEGAQVSSGGNGVGGADETSEPSATTWQACTSVTIAQGTDFIFADGFGG